MKRARWMIFWTGVSISVFMALLVSAGAVLQQPEDESVLRVQPAAQATEAAIDFPVEIEGTGLVAEHMVCYEGPFLENSSDEPVSEVAALVIRNEADNEIAEAEVTLEKGETRLIFHGYDIMPGQSVMVLEKNGKAYTDKGFTACYGWAREAESPSFPLDQLTIESVDMGTLAVTNLTEEALRGICLYHKNYMPDGTYIGGISYHTRIEVLEPGQTVYVQPEHYADGYSKVFKVTVE